MPAVIKHMQMRVKDPETGEYTLIDTMRGPQGPAGRDGEDGAPGQPGQDGVSPAVTVADITGGHRVTITDAQGTRTFDVMDGEKGDPGDPADTANKADIIVNTASGAIASFADGVGDALVKSCIVQIAPMQSGSGDPSPENVRPITGWTGANIVVSPTTDDEDGTTYSVTFPTEAGTVYGGTLDVTNGVLTVDRAIYTWTSGGRLTNRQAFALDKSDVIRVDNDNQLTLIGAVCDKLPSGTWGRITTGNANMAGCVYGNGLAIRIAGYTTAEEYTAWLAENTPTFAYLLNAPTTYQLTPQEITTLLGQNNIWADTGDVSVAYCADTKKYVDGKIDDTAGDGDTDKTWSADKLTDALANAGTVQDVQIDGTSILQNGVANVPVASTTDVGVMKVGSGLSISQKTLYTNPADQGQIKSASALYRPIVPNTQHQSTFYGLAKAAGDTTQSASSNAVGNYTDAAKVAIQKMLGIYQAPWELIREDTFTNAEEADHIITVDGNGEPFQLTDVIFMFEFPVQNNVAKKMGSGQVRFYYNGGGSYIAPESGQWTQEANADAHGFMMYLHQNDGMMFVERSAQTTSTNNGSIAWRYLVGLTSKLNGIFMLDSELYIDKVNIIRVTGTGHYRMFGKRKWN